MTSNMEVLLHIAFMVTVTLVTVATENSQADLCDIRLWYSDQVSDGLLSGELSKEQLTIKSKVETMMAKLKAEKRGMGVDCSKLTAYEEYLRDGSHSPRRGETTDSEDISDKEDPREEITDNSSDVAGDSSSIELSDPTEADETELSDDLDPNYDEDTAKISTDESSTSSSAESNSDIFSDETKENASFPNSLDNQRKKLTLRDIWNSTCKQKTRSKSSCRYLHFLLHVCFVHDDHNEGSSQSVRFDIIKSCHNRNKCTLQCYYAFENSQCLPFYAIYHNVSAESSTENNDLSSNNSSQRRDGSAESEVGHSGTNGRIMADNADDSAPRKSLENDAGSVDKMSGRETEGRNGDTLSVEDNGGNKNGERDTQFHEREKTNEEMKTSTDDDKTSQLDEEREEDDNHRDDDAREVEDDTSSDSRRNSDFTPLDDNRAENGEDDSDKIIKTTTEGKQGRENPADMSENQDQTNDGKKSVSSPENRDAQNVEDVLRGIKAREAMQREQERLEQLIQQRTVEYASKIQSLEILIMRLENQILTEKLDKQNDTNTFSRLENHILKLENDLLRLNRSYGELKDENAMMKLRQRKYLELDHVKDGEPAGRSGDGSKHHEMITQQQTRISELRDVLKNQSSLLDRLKGKAESLEEQNQLLYQIVMNQTALISNIMQKMQELSEDSLKQKQETQNLMSKVEIHASSSKLFEKIENFVSTAQQRAEDVDRERHLRADVLPTAQMRKQPVGEDQRRPSDSEAKGDEIDQSRSEKTWLPTKEDPATVKMSQDESEKIPNMERTHIRDFFPQVPDATVDFKNWRCNGNNSTRICFMYSIIISPCPPFSTVHWNPCPFYFSEIRVLSSSGEEHNEENATNQPQKIEITSASVKSGQEKGDVTKKLSQTGEVGDKRDMKEKDEEKTGEKENKKLSEKEEKELMKMEEKLTSEKGADAMQKNSNQMTGDNVNEESNDQKKNKADDAATKGMDDGKEKKSDGEEKKVKKVNDQKKQKPENKVQKKGAQPPLENPEKRQILYTTPYQLKPKDCYDLYKKGKKQNGIYRIYPLGMQHSLDVFCDMKGGGWTVIQRRQDGSEEFYRGWEDYQEGFGSPEGEHWLGNDHLHFLTNQDRYSLQVNMSNWNEERRHALYKDFWVDGEEDAYELHIYEYSGDAGDGLLKHNRMKFSTHDRDNDLVVKEFGGSCAKRFQGAGWYYKCYASNLNGKYYTGGVIPEKKYDGITWKAWLGPNQSMKDVTMKIRPISAVDG